MKTERQSDRKTKEKLAWSLRSTSLSNKNFTRIIHIKNKGESLKELHNGWNFPKLERQNPSD